jgi:predicted alpha/beta hydrolase
MIKVLHSGWFEHHGACAACWSFYRNLVRVLNASGFFDTRFRIRGRGGNASVNPNGNDSNSLQYQRPKT